MFVIGKRNTIRQSGVISPVLQMRRPRFREGSDEADDSQQVRDRTGIQAWVPLPSSPFSSRKWAQGWNAVLEVKDSICSVRCCIQWIQHIIDAQ